MSPIEIRTELGLSDEQAETMRRSATRLEGLTGASVEYIHVMPQIFIRFTNGASAKFGLTPEGFEDMDEEDSED